MCSGQGVIPDPDLASEPCSTLGGCTTATCCSKNCVGFGDCGAEALVSTPASTSCGSAGDDCGDLSWTQCFDLFCVKGFVRILLECRCVLESASFDSLASHHFGECWGKKWIMYIYMYTVYIYIHKMVEPRLSFILD